MSAGTKIVLALITLFIGVLVVYYGFVMPAGEMPRNDTLPRDVATDPVQGESGDVAAATGEARDRSQPRSRTTNHPRNQTRTRDRNQPPVGTRTPGSPDDTATSAAPPELVMGEPTTGHRTTRAPSGESTPAARPNRSAPLAAATPGRLTRSAPAPDNTASSTRDRPSSTTKPPRTPSPVPAADRSRTTPRPRPVSGDSTPAPAPRPQYTTYTVRNGDSMSSIAASWFGDETKWHLIAKANPLVDPNQLSIGQALRLPAKSAARTPVPRATPTRAVVYRVRSGDTLSRIASEHYGDARLWKHIHAANRAVIGSDPGALSVGMELTLPPKP